MPTKNIIFLDIETDSLRPTEIHCCVTICQKGVVSIHTSKDSLEKLLVGDYKLCGHNIIGFDAPALRDVWGMDIPDEVLIDTLVMSRLYHPDIEGGHSLDAWGTRLDFKKIEFHDYEKLSDEMIAYCIRDVEITKLLYDRLSDSLMAYSFSKQSIDLEHSVACICRDQERNGFLFDKEKAVELYEELTTRMIRMEKDLQSVFPPIVQERYSEKTGKRLKDSVTVFNVGSRQQIAERLASKGAVWKELTPSGKPKVDESTLKKQTHIPEAKIILRYLLCQKRASQVDSWIQAVEEDGRIHGRVRHIGAVTGRMAHSNPNLAQVPAVGAEYGVECRALFIADDDKVLVGADASGLELRMLAHYMNDEGYTNELLNGDIHTANQRAAGLESRPLAKTFIYAFLYGAGDAKIGSIVGGNSSVGRELKNKFLSNTPSLERLRRDVSRQASSGFLIGLDGRQIRVRSEHAALNTLLQGAGAVVMKQAIVILYDLLQDVEFKLVAQVHDEWQIECRPADAGFIGKACVEAMVRAGQMLGLNCPLDGEYRVGYSWATTH